jgi:hypothetical protein
MLRTLPLFALVLLCSCADENRSQTTRVAEKEAAASSNAPVFVAYRREADFPVPDTWSDGVFRIERNCLVLRTSSGETFVAVLPPNLRVDGVTGTQASRGPGALVIGHRYRVTGGEGSYAVVPAPPEGCRYNQFLVGEVR